MEGESRIDAARRRVRASRYVIGVAATVAFAGVGLLVRAAHPGHATGTAGTSSASIPQSAFRSAEQSDGSFFGGGGTIAPSGSTGPAVQSGGS